MRLSTTNSSKEREEREMADFLSSIDEHTGSSKRVSSTAGGDLFFDTNPSLGNFNETSSTTASKRGASQGVEYKRVLEEGTTPDWLQDFQAPNAQGAPRDRASRTMRAVRNDNNDSYGEVPGAEPEILDEEFLSVGYKSRTGGERMRGGEKHADGYRSGTGTAEVRATGADATTAASMKPGRALPGGSDAENSAPSSERDQNRQRLDWPQAMDMLGLTVSDGQKRKQQHSGAAAGLPVTGLPTMPPPPPRKGLFPDFVEIRDPRLVSQWPKPSGCVSSGGSVIGETPTEGTPASGAHGEAGVAGTWQQHSPLPAPLRTVEMYLRPDVTWASVSDVYMAVMLSRGLVVREETEKMVTAEKAADSSGDWATVTLRVGVTRDKLRTLVMQFYADARAPILSLASTVGRFSGKAGDELYSAIRDALVERRMPLSFLTTDAREVSLDPHYVRDLVAMYAHENVVNLTRYALPLEEFVRSEEERTARLEATLLPKYRAYGLAPPRPTRSKPLSAYPLTTNRPPVSSCGVERAREVIERAREHAGNVFEDAGDASGMPGAGKGEDPETVAEGIRALLKATWEDVKEWCDEEAQARVRRKDSQVRDRLVAVERHREALVNVIRDGGGGSNAQSTQTGREFASRFRPMAADVVLSDCKAVHDRRVGQLYLTFNHLCFHSSMLGFTHQKVLPLVTLASASRPVAAMPVAVDTLTVKDHGGESYSFGISTVEAGFPERFHDLLQQVLGMCKVDAARRAAKEATTVGQDALDDEPDEVQILARVRRFAKEKQLREAREQEAAAASAAAAPPSDLSLDAADGARAPTLSGSPSFEEAALPSQHDTPLVCEEAGSRLEIGEAWENSDETNAGQEEDSTGPSVAGASSSPAPALAPAPAPVSVSVPVSVSDPAVRNETGGRGSGRGSRGASMMAMGIQAFLEESQRKS